MKSKGSMSRPSGKLNETGDSDVTEADLCDPDELVAPSSIENTACTEDQFLKLHERRYKLSRDTCVLPIEHYALPRK